MNLPRGSFSLSGGQYAESLALTNGKMPTDGPPMIIVDTPPGVFGSEWVRTFGASQDAYLTLVNGRFLQSSMDEISVEGIYQEGSVNAITDNLWKPAVIGEGSVQQVQYLVSKTTIDEASAATESYGEINEVRGIGLRIPAIAGGYGRTIDGLPTDPEPTDDLTKRKNDESHKVARETWKYGPVEYRWDYRKGVWSAYNELIADHENEELGTWVFSTNPDTDHGFPFLRGKLEDVFWVRRTHDKRDLRGNEEGVQTGEVMTHLEHKWYDDAENGSARLSSIFIIPHTESAAAEGDEDGCHFIGENENELGDEITGDADRIDIKHDAHFFKEKNVDGAIHFGAKASDLVEDEVISCYNPNAKYFFGEMVFIDEMPPGCSEEGELSSAPASTSGVDDHQCKWVPAVQIDECQLMGEHMVKLIENDDSLAGRLTTICNTFAQYTKDAKAVSDANIGDISTVLECLNTALQETTAAIIASVAFCIDELGYEIQDKFVELNQQMDLLPPAIEAALASCGCEATVDWDFDITPPGGHGFNLPSAVASNCELGTFSRAPELDCADVCFGVQLNGPCSDSPSYMAGMPCGDYELRDIGTSEGTAQTHEYAE